LQTRTKPAFQGRNHVFKVGVQFLGLGYYTEQNTDGTYPVSWTAVCYVIITRYYTRRLLTFR